MTRQRRRRRRSLLEYEDGAPVSRLGGVPIGRLRQLVLVTLVGGILLFAAIVAVGLIVDR